MKFNEKLLKLRKEKGLSQEELGMEMQVSRQTISKWEAGQSYPDFTRLVRESSLTNEKIDSIYRVSQAVDSVFQNKMLKDFIKGIWWFIVGSLIFMCVVAAVVLIRNILKFI